MHNNPKKVMKIKDSSTSLLHQNHPSPGELFGVVAVNCLAVSTIKKLHVCYFMNIVRRIHYEASKLGVSQQLDLKTIWVEFPCLKLNLLIHFVSLSLLLPLLSFCPVKPIPSVLNSYMIL